MEVTITKLGTAKNGRPYIVVEFSKNKFFIEKFIYVEDLDDFTVGLVLTVPAEALR